MTVSDDGWIDTTKLNAGQLVQRIMRAMDGDVSSFNNAGLAEHIAAEILKLPKDYWRKGGEEIERVRAALEGCGVPGAGR
jgi:hypothetical protein